MPPSTTLWASVTMRADGLRHRTVVAVRRRRRPEAADGSLQHRVNTVRDVGNLSDLEYGPVFGVILGRAPANVILVDGPMAWRPEHPGRGESIAPAAKLAGPACCLFVHDYDRVDERACYDELLGAPLDTVDRLAVRAD